MKEKNVKNQRRIPKQARALAKYNAVLDACTQVLQRNGYAKTSIMELSLESGVAVPTIYQYFENKEEIFVAWVNRVIDNVLGQVSYLEGTLADEQLETYIDVLVNGALLAVSSYRESLHQLVSGVPQVLSSLVISTMENKTTEMIGELFSRQIDQIDDDHIQFKLQVLVRLIIGYFLQMLLSGPRSIDVQAESRELATVVKVYLRQNAVIG